ncbi:hypothetical protein R3P38DRAFT_3452593 [Favolaschia claudopus]|uniref:Uncharacterized protein n=1 Tax=Favolaschia claudopus TaxID=2862362 RepID=A0AAV9ZJP2_9AGAR
MFFDLYGVGAKAREVGNSVPFIQHVELGGPRGEIVRMRSVIDDGAMVSAIDADVYEKIKHRLAPLRSSARILRMADGRLTPGGAWALLFGKPLLEKFDAVHEYSPDVLHLRDPSGWVSLQNQFYNVAGTPWGTQVGLTTDIKQRTNFSGGNCASPSRRVHTPLETIPEERNDQLIEQYPRQWYSRQDRRRNLKARLKAQAQDCTEDIARDRSRGDGEPPSRRVSAEILHPTMSTVDESNSRKCRGDGEKIEARAASVEIRGDDEPPTRRVSQPNSSDVEERLDQPTSFIPAYAHPLTSTGEPRRTYSERAAWRLARGCTAKKTRAERTTAHRLRENPEKRNPLVRRYFDQYGNAMGVTIAPAREVPPHLALKSPIPRVDNPSPSQNNPVGAPEDPEKHWGNTWILDDAAGPGDEHPGRRAAYSDGEAGTRQS